MLSSLSPLSKQHIMINRLIQRLNLSTCNVLAVETIKKELLSAGFTELDPSQAWQIEPNGKYFVRKNGTAIFAVVAGSEAPAANGFNIISAHSDSPCLKVKPNAEIYCEGGIVKLNVEKYGGGILYTWFDRPLSLSGRVTLRSDNPLRPTIVPIDLKDKICTIPHLAIHFNRAVNEGNKLSVQKDMLPVVGIFTPEEIADLKANGGVIKQLLAKHGIDTHRLLDYELNLYPVEEAHTWGTHNEFISSGRIDDLSMAFAGLEALLATHTADSKATRVLAIFDNEETGSGTKQGAHSPVLGNILERVSNAFCSKDAGAESREEFHRAVSNSFMISADDAHGWHPNYNEKYDPTNHPILGKGPVVKINANCKYMTDADGAAVFKALCEKANVPCQYFVNHSDVLGGSTLGNIFTSQLDIRGVDVGNAIWAMHSASETGACRDHEYMVAAFSEFYKL